MTTQIKYTPPRPSLGREIARIEDQLVADLAYVASSRDYWLEVLHPQPEGDQADRLRSLSQAAEEASLALRIYQRARHERATLWMHVERIMLAQATLARAIMRIRWLVARETGFDDQVQS